MKRAAIIATGWLGDTIACSAAAVSLREERGFDVDFYIKWPQLLSILSQDERYQTVTYSNSIIGKWKLCKSITNYELVIREPKTWSYSEPFTSEIRRVAGCTPKPEFQLRLPRATNFDSSKSKKDRPQLAISRDLYKRAFGRDVNEFVSALRENFDVLWVGLPPEKSSKKGRSNDLLDDAKIIHQSNCFIGPEGGLLWLAAGIGVRTIYFTENILHVQKLVQRGDAMSSLGSVNLFPQGNHVALPAYCTNDEAITRIRSAVEPIVCESTIP